VLADSIHAIELQDKDKTNILPQILLTAGLAVSNVEVVTSTAAATAAAIAAATGGGGGGGGGGGRQETLYEMTKMAGALAAAGVKQETAAQVAARAAVAPSPAEAAMAAGGTVGGATQKMISNPARKTTQRKSPTPPPATVAAPAASAPPKKQQQQQQPPPQQKPSARKPATRPVVTPVPVPAPAPARGRASGNSSSRGGRGGRGGRGAAPATAAAPATKQKVLYDPSTTAKPPVFNGSPAGTTPQPSSSSTEPEVVLKQDEWKCEACTYIDKNYNKECQMCGTEQPFMLVPTKAKPVPKSKKQKKKKGGGRGQAVSLASLLGPGTGGGGGYTGSGTSASAAGGGGVRVPAQTIPRGVVSVVVPEHGAIKIQQGQNGFLFVCARHTYDECIDKELFGLPYNEFRGMQIKLVPENNQQGRPPTLLYLFNITTTDLEGVFVATSAPAIDIDPMAWKSKKSPGGFPAQVQIRRIRTIPRRRIGKRAFSINCGLMSPDDHKLAEQYLQGIGLPEVQRRYDGGGGKLSTTSMTYKKS